MKKLLFVLAFTFIGQQAFSQIYLVTLGSPNAGGCADSQSTDTLTLTKISPTGVQTHTCISSHVWNGALISLNQELNSIVNQGYKLIETNNGYFDANGLYSGTALNRGTTWYFAIP